MSRAEMWYHLELIAPCVIYKDIEDRTQKSHLVSTNMVETGENISAALFSTMDKLNIPYKVMLVSERTDGCTTMLGVPRKDENKILRIPDPKNKPRSAEEGAGCSRSTLIL